MLTQQELFKVIKYDPINGLFYRKYRMSSNWVLLKFKSKRKVINVNGKSYNAARLAWLYVHGTWPKGVIDHINRDYSDDRICNLRNVSYFENIMNSPYGDDYIKRYR